MTETRAEYEARTGAYPVARYEDLPKAVQEMNFMFKGNVIPHTWYGHIRHKGRTDIAAILILAEIAYWYRPREGKDELTGQVTFAKGFQADKLQKSYGQLEELFGFTSYNPHATLKVP